MPKTTIMENYMDTKENTAPKAKKNLVRSGLVLSLMTFASRIMGLIREMTKASFLGTGLYADAFTSAFMMPNLFRRLFAEGSISVAFIPTFKKYLTDAEKGENLDSKKETQNFLNATFTLITFLTTCVVVIGVLAAPLIALIFCGQKPADTSLIDYAAKLDFWNMNMKEITVLTRIMFPYLIVISIAALFQGILNGCNIFAPSGFTPVLFNSLVITVTYILAPRTSNPARAMAIGVIVGGISQALFQLPFMLKTGWKVGFTSLKKTFTNPGTRKVIALVGPTIIGMAAYQLNDLVSTQMAYRAGEGITSSLQYSLRLQELILGIFAVSIGTVILPDLSGLASEKKWDDFNKMLIQAIKIITMITIPVTFYSLISGRELISLLYKNKMFDEKSVLLTLGEFRFHISGLFFIALNRIISPSFYAQGNTKLPTWAGIISFVANIIFVLILVNPMSGNGIALALSLASAMNTLFLFIFMKKMNSYDIKKILKASGLYFCKLILMSVVASVPTYFVRKLVLPVFADYSRILSQGLPILITAIVFAIIGVAELVITKDEVVMVILKKFRKR